MVNPTITYDDFTKVEIRLGKITRVEAFPEAKKPAWKLWIDFGSEIGEKKSSAQIVANYSAEQLIGRYVFGVVNFPPRQIGPFISEVLTLGVYDTDGTVRLANIDGTPPLGAKLS